MNTNNQPLTKRNFDESISKLQATLVGGMNQMLPTLIDHMDKRFEAVDDRFERLERKLDNTSDDLTQRLAKLEKQQV